MGGFGFLPTSVISKITSKNPIAEVIHKKVKNEVTIAFSSIWSGTPFQIELKRPRQVRRLVIAKMDSLPKQQFPIKVHELV